MKKLLLLFFSLLAFGYMFQACDNSKTYAEMLDEEKDAVNAFIKKHDIRTISESDFEANGYKTDTTKNEYVAFSNGVYMQIVDKGSTNPADTVKPNDLILVRFEEQGLIAVGGVKSYITNMNSPTVVDEFRYSVTSSSIAGLFTQGYMLIYHGSSVPAGWLVALNYIRNGAHVKLIVPSKMGQSDAMRDVHPYYYDLHKLQIWN